MIIYLIWLIIVFKKYELIKKNLIIKNRWSIIYYFRELNPHMEIEGTRYDLNVMQWSVQCFLVWVEESLYTELSFGDIPIPGITDKVQVI